MATNRTTVIPIGIMPKTKTFFLCFYGNYKNFCGFFCLFFQQGNDTHTVVHIIDNIELKLDFANLKSQIKSQCLSKKSQLDILPKSHSPSLPHPDRKSVRPVLLYVFYGFIPVLKILVFTNHA